MPNQRDGSMGLRNDALVARVERPHVTHADYRIVTGTGVSMVETEAFEMDEIRAYGEGWR